MPDCSRLDARWQVCDLTRSQLRQGTKPEDITIPNDIPSCKKNLIQWLSSSVERLEQDTAGVLKAWEQTRLLLAWERATQVEAVGKASELFPDATAGGTAKIIIEAAPPTEADEDAGIAGLPFMQTEHEDEHEEWIDWAAVEQQAGGGGGSSS